MNKGPAGRAIGGRTAALASQNLFGATARASWSNRRQKFAFAALTVAIAIAVAFLARFLTAPRTLVFATGPESSVEYGFARRLQAATAQNRRVRIDVRPLESFTAAATWFSQARADLMIARSDTKIPGRARAVAILDHSLLLIAAPRSAKAKSIAALKGKRLAIIGDDVRDSALVRDVLAFYGFPPSAPIEERHAAEWPHLFEANGPGAVFYIVRKSKIATDIFWPDRAQKPNFDLIEADGSKALAARMRGVEAETIDAGLIVPSPKIPDDDLETISVEDILLCHSRLPEATATELAVAVFENKDQLGELGRYATAIEPPSTDKDSTVLAHPGVAEYVDDDTKTFLDRYSDMIYIGMSVASVVGSVFLGLYSTVTRAPPKRAGQLTDAVLALGDRATHAQTFDEIAALETELNQLVAAVLAGVRDGTVANDGFGAFRLAFDVAREALALRKDAVLAQLSEAKDRPNA